MSKSLDDLRASVEANRSAVSSAVTLIQGIATQLKDAAANDDSDAVEQLATDLNAQAQNLAQAVTANTPQGGAQSTQRQQLPQEPAATADGV